MCKDSFRHVRPAALAFVNHSAWTGYLTDFYNVGFSQSMIENLSVIA